MVYTVSQALLFHALFFPVLSPSLLVCFQESLKPLARLTMHRSPYGSVFVNSDALSIYIYIYIYI